MPGSTSNASFLGAVTFSSSDGTQALTIANASGNEASGALNFGPCQDLLVTEQSPVLCTRMS